MVITKIKFCLPNYLPFCKGILISVLLTLLLASGQKTKQNPNPIKKIHYNDHILNERREKLIDLMADHPLVFVRLTFLAVGKVLLPRLWNKKNFDK
jgi:hypothetical protein